MSFARLRLPVLLRHTLAWVVFILTQNLLSYLGTPLRISLARTLLTFPLVIGLFYLHVALVNWALPRRQWPALALGTAALLVGFAAVRLVLYRFGLPALGLWSGSYAPLALLTKHFLLDTIWLGGQYLLYSYGYWFAAHTLRLEREQRRLQESVFQLEKARLEAEMAFLRQQLNPHFLFNTFNFLYAEALPCAPRLADSILSLTHMMRTITAVGRADLLPLSQELDYIEHYLKIQQYRFEERLQLRFSVRGQERADHLRVPPLLFISLLENVFKYGELSEATAPAEVSFRLHDNTVEFRTHNLKKSLAGRPVPGGGVGLSNIRQQLSQHYPQQHTLRIHDTPTEFTVELMLHSVPV